MSTVSVPIGNRPIVSLSEIENGPISGGYKWNRGPTPEEKSVAR